MEKVATDLLIERLADWGVDTAFGLPGDGRAAVRELARRGADGGRRAVPVPTDVADPGQVRRPPSRSRASWGRSTSGSTTP